LRSLCPYPSLFPGNEVDPACKGDEYLVEATSKRGENVLMDPDVY